MPQRNQLQASSLIFQISLHFDASDHHMRIGHFDEVA